MRLAEWMTLHALLRAVRDDMTQRDDIAPNAFAAYDSQPARPMHLHRQKEAHKRATRLLLWGVVRSIETESDLSVAPR